MQNKLQELTDKLYNEGLSKGKAEAQLLVNNAQQEADAIISKAKAEAAAIIESATKQTEDIKAKANADIKMAAEQSLQATKKDVENLIIAKVSDEKISKLLSEPDFLKSIITTVAEKFSSEQACDLSLILPAALQKDLEPFVKAGISKAVGKAVEVEFSKKISGGFSIGPKDGGYFISLTDETFKSLIGEYLRPITKKLLFG